jgi:chromosome segregation ATPase
MPPRCSECNGEIYDSDIICPHCGHHVALEKARNRIVVLESAVRGWKNSNAALKEKCRAIQDILEWTPADDRNMDLLVENANLKAEVSALKEELETKCRTIKGHVKDNVALGEFLEKLKAERDRLKGEVESLRNDNLRWRDNAHATQEELDMADKDSDIYREALEVKDKALRDAIGLIKHLGGNPKLQRRALSGEGEGCDHDWKEGRTHKGRAIRRCRKCKRIQVEADEPREAEGNL